MGWYKGRRVDESGGSSSLKKIMKIKRTRKMSKHYETNGKGFVVPNRGGHYIKKIDTHKYHNI